MFRCTVDSFLQPNLTVCQEMYQSIQNSLTEFSYPISLAGLGDDTLNIANYLGLPSTNLLHCHDTMKISLPEDSGVIATLDLDVWVTSCRERQSNVLLITPGRKGLKSPEMRAVLGLNFYQIIYIACCPQVLPTEFQLFANKYQIISTKQFPMYESRPHNLDLLRQVDGIDSNKYLETVQIWQQITSPKYVDYSIGEDCCVQYHLKHAVYSPLSWCKSMSFDLIVHLFETRFRELLIKSNWKMQKTTRQFIYIEHDVCESQSYQSQSCQSQSCQSQSYQSQSYQSQSYQSRSYQSQTESRSYQSQTESRSYQSRSYQSQTESRCYQSRSYQSQTESRSYQSQTGSERHLLENPELAIYRIEIATQQKLVFPHQIRAEFLESDLENCLQKLERRIDRMYDRSIPIRLFRYESKPQQINTDNLNRLFKFCDRLIIITPSPEKISVRHPQLEIWPDVYYQSHESWKRERLAELFKTRL